MSSYCAVLLRCLLLPCLLLSGLAGCRNTAGLFLPVDQHPEVMGQARQAAAWGDARAVEGILSDLDRQLPSNSHLLGLLERGRLSDLVGEGAASRAAFAEADQLFDEERLRASLTVTETLESAVALMTNDRALAYRGGLHERLLMAYFQSLNWLNEGDVPQARVELNKALRDMRWADENLPGLRQEAQTRLGRSGLRAEGLEAHLDGLTAGLPEQSSADNALIYYLSGLLFETLGELDRAEIDYRNALAKAPGTPPIADALAHLGKSPAGTGRLVILHESDWVSAKYPFSLSVFLNERSYTLSLPTYPQGGQPLPYPQSFLAIGEERPLLYPVLNVDALARQALREAFPAILLRQALRMAAKQEMQAEAHEADPWLGLMASLFSILSDSPDLRSWLSLPAAVTLADLRLPAGPVNLSMDMTGGISADHHLSADEVTILRLITANGQVIRVDSLKIPVYSPP